MRLRFLTHLWSKRFVKQLKLKLLTPLLLLLSMSLKEDALLKTLDIFVILEGLRSLQCCVLSVSCMSVLTTHVILLCLPQKHTQEFKKRSTNSIIFLWLILQNLEMSSPSTFVKSNFISLILTLFFIFSISTIASSPIYIYTLWIV